MLAEPVFALGLLGWGLTIGGVIAFVLAVVTIVSVFQNHELTGAEKAVWVAAVILFPILGALVYFGVRRDW